MVTIREAAPDEAAAIARVHVDAWRTTYRGIIPDEYLASLSHEERTARWRENLREAVARNECVFVAAEENGEVVGFAAGGPGRDNDPHHTGELYVIYLDERRRGYGIGRRLVAAVALRLSELGHTSISVWVLERNPACGFYTALGGVRFSERTVTVGGRELREAGYGWADLRPLTGTPPAVM